MTRSGRQGLITETEAHTSQPSPRPTKPRRSVVVAFTETASTGTPITRARVSRIVRMYGASLGSCRAMVMSALPTRQPRSPMRATTFASRILLSMPLHSSDVSGKRWPMSPRAKAPRMASQSAWMATSPSECATKPTAEGMFTPPSHIGSPSSRACTSYPFPILSSIATKVTKKMLHL